MQRVIAYIDGFDLYYSLKSKKWDRFYWLDIQSLSIHLLKPDQRLVATKYFTSRIGTPRDKSERQNRYLEALETLPSVSIFFGHYHRTQRPCSQCRFPYYATKQKMSDVNLATELLQDAFTDAFDTALILSSSSSLAAPIAAVRKLFPNKRIVVASPPGKSSVTLTKAAHAYLQIGHGSIEKSQLPRVVRTKTGHSLSRPLYWT